jgi:hypothetical protein
MPRQHFMIYQANRIIWPKLSNDASKRMGDLKSAVIVLYPPARMRAAIKVKSLARFLAAIENAHVDVRVLHMACAVLRRFAEWDRPSICHRCGTLFEPF